MSELASNILKSLRRAGIRLIVRDGGIKVSTRSTRTVLTQEEQQALDANKSEIIELLNSESANKVLPKGEGSVKIPKPTIDISAPLTRAETFINNAVRSFNGSTGSVEGVNTVCGQTGDVHDVVCSFNGRTGAVTGVDSVNGKTGAVTVTDLVGVSTFNGESGDVQGISSFNGSTGAINGVGSVNGLTGSVTLDLGVSSFNSSTGSVEGVSSFNSATGDIFGVNSVNGSTGAVTLDLGVSSLNGVTGVVEGVSTFNGATGVVEGVSTFNGATGAITTSGSVLHVSGISSDSGATFGSNVSIVNVGDVALTVKGDTDNSGENDNPLIRLEQDGGAVSCNIGINGDSNNQFIGAQPNAFYIEAESSSGSANQLIQFATNNADVMTLNGDGNVGINTSIPSERLDVVGTIQSTGITSGGATFGSLNVGGAYNLPTADGSAGQVLMTDGSDAVSFQTIKFTTSFVLDSDIPLATGSRDKALYYVPYDNAVITEVILRSEDAAASGDVTSLVVALEGIQRTTLLNDADPATGSTIMSATLNDTTDNHYDLNQGLSHAIGGDNNVAFLRINVTDNSGNHTHCQVMIKMEARTT
jgi:hypothetical protein